MRQITSPDDLNILQFFVASETRMEQRGLGINHCSSLVCLKLAKAYVKISWNVEGILLDFERMFFFLLSHKKANNCC